MTVEEPAVEAPGHPAVVRVRARNPGPMTLSGTNTYVVGSSPAWVIDPGPADRGHIELVRRVGGTRGGIAGVLLTHSHSDHNAGCAMLGVEVVVGSTEPVEELSEQRTASSEQRLRAGADRQVGPFRAVPTPGHAADHLVFVYGEVCFCGDLVLGEGSSIVPPRAAGGSLTDYMSSLDAVAALGAALLCPGHGGWITDPAAKLAEYAAHRRERERLLVAALDSGLRSEDALLDAAWSDVPPPMRPAAALAMGAHIEKLAAEGRLPGDYGPPG